MDTNIHDVIIYIETSSTLYTKVRYPNITPEDPNNLYILSLLLCSANIYAIPKGAILSNVERFNTKDILLSNIPTEKNIPNFKGEYTTLKSFLFLFLFSILL
ncbi:hypothetical protein D3C76_1280080 [compost metagenome]